MRNKRLDFGISASIDSSKQDGRVRLLILRTATALGSAALLLYAGLGATGDAKAMPGMVCSATSGAGAIVG